MEIHFIWINDFPRLEKTGINLSARLIVDMKPVMEGQDQFILTVSENPDFIQNFFEKENITNVTAIIGKNGSGKTSILKYIRSNLPEGLEARVSDDVFIYSIQESEDNEKFFIIKPDHFEIKLENSTKYNFEDLIYGQTVNDSFRFTGGLQNIEYIYYSYLLEFNHDSTPWRGLTDISTTFLMSEERRRIIEENHDAQTRQTRLAHCNELDNLHVSEVARAIQFLLSDSTSLPFERPDSLIIEIDLNDILFFTNQESDYPEVVGTIKNIQNIKNLDGDLTGNLINNFLLSILVNFLVNDYKYSPNNPYFHKLDQFQDQSIKDFILDYFKSMNEVAFRFQGHIVTSQKHEDLSKLVPEFVELLEQLILNEDITVIDHKTMRLVLNSETETAFKEFTTLYLKIKGISTFLNFRWRSLSGGEQSYLSLMSRFYHVKHHKIGDLPRDLVILIDEGDIGFHPDWQRRFFNLTLSFLSELFSNHRLQLIITANTPFITSDLPKTHILFIELKENMPIFHPKENSRESTFAANIHTLFSNSFYMDGLLIGDFAKRKINKIINYLKETEANESPKEDYKKAIDLIGEPVLRKKLQDMWFEKFGLDEELQVLQKRIEEINRIKGNK